MPSTTAKAERPAAGTLEWGALAMAVLAGHVSLFPRIADLDGFYHLGHAAHYLTHGPFDSAFPWATQSVMSVYGGDLWWGLHVLLLPFAALGDPTWGLRLAAPAFTAALAGTVVWVLRRHGVPWAGFWAAAALVAVPNVFYRFLMVRPHVLSLAAALALASVLVRGRAWWVFGLSALIAWIHLSLFWLPVGVVAAYALVRGGEWVRAHPQPSAPPTDGARPVPVHLAVPAVFFGVVVGWLARPDPLAAGMLANVQLVRLFAEKASSEPLLFSPELSAISLEDLALMSWLFLAAWLAGVGVAVRRLLGANGPPDSAPADAQEAERTRLAAVALLVSAVFLALALTSARRAMEQWVSFGVLALALLISSGPRPLAWLRHRRWQALLSVVLAAHLVWGARRHALNVRYVAFLPDRLASAAAFLQEHSEPGEVVFHLHWDDFGPLFARNRVNLYLGGMDPIFQYVYSPERYWEHFHLSTDVHAERTCATLSCAPGSVVDSYTAIREHFGARWVVVEPRRNPRVALFLLRDPRFRLAHDAPREAVFEVLPPEER